VDEDTRRKWFRGDRCVLCGNSVEGEESAIIGPFLAGSEFFDTIDYQPFVEDMRSGSDLAHPQCFANEYGVDALVQVIHEHDRRHRHM